LEVTHYLLISDIGSEQRRVDLLGHGGTFLLFEEVPFSKIFF
jgi:hypothetical protein